MADAGPVGPDALRLHGGGDGSVMAYCGACRQPLEHLPRGRVLTLAVLVDRWNEHGRTAHPVMWAHVAAEGGTTDPWTSQGPVPEPPF